MKCVCGAKMSRITAIISAVIICLIVCLGWLANHYTNATEFKRQRDEKVKALELANATITDMQTRQRDVAALDAKYTKELADAKSQLEDLQRCVSSGKCGLRLNATCPKMERPPPAAWAMLPAPDLQTPLNGIISPLESGSLPSSGK